MLKFWIRCRTIHLLFDIIAVYGAFQLAYFLRVGWIFSTDFNYLTFSLMSCAGALLWILFLAFARYYRIPPRSGAKEWYDLILIIIGGVIANGSLIVIYFFPQEILFSRLITVYALLFGCMALLVSQMVFKWFMSQQKKGNRQVYRLLIVGANRVSENFIHQVQTNPYALYEVVGVIDPYGLKKDIKGSQILGKLDKLEKICDEEGITAILQCDAFEQTINLISLCEEKRIKFQFDPALRGIFEKNLRIREVAGHTTISFVKRYFNNTSKKTLYRGYDAVLNQVFEHP